MAKNENQKWEKFKKMGKKKFIWTHGVMRWGVLVAVIWSLINQGLRGGFNLNSFFTLEFLGRFGISLVIFCIAGYFWGRMFWNSMEKN